MLKDFIKVLLLIFLATLASVAYAQDSENTSESVPKEFINIQQDVFDSLNLIFEKNSQELDVIQKKLSDNLDVIFEEKSQELSNIQSEVFQNLDGIFETNSKELADVQTDLNKLSKQISEIRLELSENKDFAVTEAINAAEGIVASGIKKSAGNVLFRINAIEEEMRNLTGIIEELQFYTRNIAIDATNRIGDLEFRLTELEGGDLLLLGKPREIGGNLNTLNNAELAVTEKSSYETAQKLLKDNDFQSALLEFNKLITAFPNSPLIASAYYNMGDAYSGLSDWELAGKSYLESFKLEPNGKFAAKALMNVGISLGKMQKINEACNILSKVELRFPNNQIVEEAQNEMQILGCS